MAQQIFDKPKFANLLKQAMGNRNMSQYAMNSGVSLTYVSKLIRQLSDRAPQPETINKLAKRAHNGVTYSDLMAAAGHITVMNKANIQEDNSNDLIDHIYKSEYYNGVPLSESDRKRIKTVLDVVFYYAQQKKI